MEFNKTVHCTDENGDPLRTEKGEIRLKPNWKEVAVDHMGRKYSPRIHGDKPELDDSGLLKMRRRDPSRKPMTASNRTEQFVSKFRQPGYEYRLVNDEGGRIAQFEKHDWEPVIDDDSKEKAVMSVGQARAPGTKAILMRKPKEWYDEDQVKKNSLLNASLESKTQPKEGQYGEGLKESGPLR